MSYEVKNFLEKLSAESCVYVPKQMEENRILLE